MNNEAIASLSTHVQLRLTVLEIYFLYDSHRTRSSTGGNFPPLAPDTEVNRCLDGIRQKVEQFQVLVDKNQYQSNFKYFTVIFTFS